MMAALCANELIAHVSEHNEVIGAVKRSVMRASRLRHRATYVFVHPSGRANELFVQRRTMIKDYCPGMWDPCAGGVVQHNESYEDNARRELQEEMGINTPLTHVSAFLFDDYCWGDIWWGEYGGTVADMQLQAEEVDKCEVMTVDDIIGARRHEMTPDGVMALEVYRQYQQRQQHR